MSKKVSVLLSLLIWLSTVLSIHTKYITLLYITSFIILDKHFKAVKCKAVPLQAWTGPEGSRKLRFLDFVTMAQDIGKVVSLTHQPLLPPGNAPGTHFC